MHEWIMEPSTRKTIPLWQTTHGEHHANVYQTARGTWAGVVFLRINAQTEVVHRSVHACMNRRDAQAWCEQWLTARTVVQSYPAPKPTDLVVRPYVHCPECGYTVDFSMTSCRWCGAEVLAHAPA